ncbi:MAG: hypothetical protein HOP17_05275 [Acidobacteria bacterium]|nr:hypothetical protein [Acidobacteriota bacterium]
MHINRPGFLFFVIAVLATSFALRAQTPSPTPSSTEKIGNYDVTSSVELGIRGLEVKGDHEKYRSDLNYRAGVRIFDSSFLLEDRSEGLKPFDSLLVQASGWGSDPSGSFRMNMERAGIYKFDTAVRRVRYFNNLKNHAVAWSQPISTGSMHRANTLHNFGDLDLTIFPESDFRMRFGYSFNDTEGPGTNSIRFSGDEYQVDSVIRGRSDDFRAGVEGKLLGFNLGLIYGHRTFKDRTLFFVDRFNPGNNPASTTSFLNAASRQFRVKGTTDFTHFFVQRTFANRLDLSGRLIYSESNSDVTESDVLTGRASATGNIIVADQIFVPGTAKRPQTRGDLGLTFRITDDLRVSNTFTFDQFNIGGSNTLFELVQTTTGAGVPNTGAPTFTSAWRTTSFRRFANLIELDYQVNPRIAFNLGYRYTNRSVTVAALDRNIQAGTITLNDTESLDNHANSFIAGMKLKPKTNWSIFFDLERGESDNVFTRLANNNFLNARVRSIANVKQFSFNMSFITKDNDSPGTSTPVTSSGGFPATETVANTKLRIFSGSVDWTPRTDLSLSGGYTYHHQTGRTDIIVPVGTPIFPTTRFLLGVSEYFVRDSFFHFDIAARPIKRVSLFASYRIDDDRGQGSRTITRPQDIVTSYPMRNHAPEIKLAIRLTKNVDWNLGYQYFSYRETPHFSPFANPLVVFPAQNYTAHMPYTSLRIYLGRSAKDR